MSHTKNELETLISQKKTLGQYVFDEAQQIFTSDVEITLGIQEIEEKLYRAEYYFFDGYEVWLNDDQKLFFKGEEAQAKEKAILSWNEKPETFMEYPIIYTNVACEIYKPDEDSASLL
ncbi:hypothetical protein BKI52_13020 [marine bacterium AO1-C]|nr:hypothetical protein BKI52_13020 [marine bacterium AO1-C]